METLASILKSIYPYTLFITIIILSIWYLLKRNKKSSKLIVVLSIISSMIYLLSFYFNYGWQFFLLFWFLRDLLFFIVIFLLIKLILKYKIVSIVLVVILVGISVFWYFKYDQLPFFSKNVAAYNSDPGAELLIDVSNKSNLDQLSAVLKNWNPKIEQAFPHVEDTTITDLKKYYTLNLDNFDDTLEIMSLIENSGLVENVEFNEIYTLSPIEQANAYDANEPKYNDTILNDLRISDQWAFNYMKIDELLKIMRNIYPLKKAKIFILDTGVDSKHEDLSDNYQSLSVEYDTDTGIHGTHCAGIAGSVSNNKIGIASLNFTGRFTTISSITVLPGGSGRQENIIDGIIMAADNGADIISMSLGGPSSEKRQKAYESAIKYANDKGAIVIVAAGNENVNARLAVPASCKGVITVSAVDFEFNKASFSNYVTDIEYKVSAPGVNILSTIPGNEYKFLNGTSMATPLVAGLAGIMKAIQPDLSTEQLYNILTNTGRETKNTELTGKFIQPFIAIKSLEKSGFMANAKNYLGKISSFSVENVEN